MTVVQRNQSFRDGKPNADLVDPMSSGPELQSNKNLSGGRDASRPLNSGLTVGYQQTGRKGRKGRTK